MIRKHLEAGHLVARDTMGVGSEEYRIVNAVITQTDFEFEPKAEGTWSCLTCRVELGDDPEDLEWFHEGWWGRVVRTATWKRTWPADGGFDFSGTTGTYYAIEASPDKWVEVTQLPASSAECEDIVDYVTLGKPKEHGLTEFPITMTLAYIKRQADEGTLTLGEVT